MNRRMKLESLGLALGLTLAVSGWLVPGAAAGEREDEALAAARMWLELTDGGKYAESWDASGSYFQEQVSKEQWVAALEEVRQPLGAVTERKVRSTQYTTDLQNAPKGEYVVIQFETSFAGREGAARELVTPRKDEDGTWRVVGYFLQ